MYAIFPFFSCLRYYINLKLFLKKPELNNLAITQLRYSFLCLLGFKQKANLLYRYLYKKNRDYHDNLISSYLNENSEYWIFGDLLLKKNNNYWSYYEAIHHCEDILMSDRYYQSKNPIDFFIAGINEGPYENKYVQISENDVIIDAGANIGIFSLLALKKGAKKIYSFEPNKKTFETLEENIRLNSGENIIEPIQKGLFDKKDSSQFIESGGGSRIVGLMESIEGDTTTISLISLDEFVQENNIKRVNFIKADIEGSERFMLKGAAETIRKYHPKLSICTYHLPDDKELLTKIILDIDNSYKFRYSKSKLFAW